MTITKETTAAQAYEMRKKEVVDLLKELAQKLKESEVPTSKANWADVGSLGFVAKGLKDILEFYGD